MKLIVIGSKGFIGSHVFKFYSNQIDVEVFGCDVVMDYVNQNYFSIDATNADYDSIFNDRYFDICINCSGAANVPDSFVHPLRDFSLNVQNVYRMLEALRKHAPNCKFLNLSSAAVYGNPMALPVTETASLTPLSPYGWHKHYAELICNQYYTIFKIPTCSLRVFSAFGPGLQKQIFWDWCQKIKGTGRLQIYGTGKESRDFIYIDDLVQAIHLVVQRGTFNAEIINVANGKEILIEKAVRIFEKESEIKFNYDFDNQIREGDPVNWLADISKLTAMGYEPAVSFETGVKKYMAWAGLRADQ